MLNINMKKHSVDYIRKINAVSSVEFGGMKNSKTRVFSFYCIISCCVSFEKKIEFHLVEIFQTKCIE